MKKTLIVTLALFLTLSLSAEEQEVFLNRDFGRLYGTLRTPDSGSDVVAILIAGSGPTDRNCNSPIGIGTNSFIYLAQALEEQGIASLRYDKRGIAASRYDDPKQIQSVTFDDYISDAIAWATWLREQGFRKIVFVGHSEGANIALCATADKTSGENSPSLVDGIVLLAGTGFPLDEVIITQLTAQLSTTNPSLLIQAITTFQSLRQGKTVDNYPKELEMLFHPSLQRYWISQLKYKPQEIARQISLPVLIVNGDNDIQISTANAAALKKAIPHAEYLIIEGMTHILKQSDKHDIQGQMEVYTNASIPLDPTLAKALPRFISSL